MGIEGRAQNIAPLQVGGIVAIEGIVAIVAIVGLWAMGYGLWGYGYGVVGEMLFFGEKG